MSSPQTYKRIAGMGLKSGQDPNPQQGQWSAERVLDAVKKEMEKAKENGFEINSYQVDISKPHDVIIDEVRAFLKNGPWDGVSIGFGLRGNEAHTPLFEKLVNTVAEEVHPTPKFIFALRPNKMWEAVSRVFEVEPAKE